MSEHYYFNNSPMLEPVGSRVPDELITDADRLLTADDRLRMNTIDSDDYLGSYHGYPDVQSAMLAAEKAEARLRQVNYRQVTKAASRLGELLPSPTPLDYSQFLSDTSGNNIYLKREDLTEVASFKLRGAYNRIAQLSDLERARGVVATSAGNHAQGVALAASRLGLTATVLMPETTPDVKVDPVAELGADVVLVGKDFGETQQHYLDNLDKYDQAYIPPFDDEQVMAGQGTVALESSRQLPKTDLMFVPVGGGGLLAGSLWATGLKPKLTVIGVEPSGSNAMTKSLANGRMAELASVDGFADGLAVKSPGKRPLETAKLYNPTMVNVDLGQICLAMESIRLTTGRAVEPSGAVALAGALNFLRQNQLSDKNVVVMISGGNVSPEKLDLARRHAGIDLVGQLAVASIGVD